MKKATGLWQSYAIFDRIKSLSPFHSVRANQRATFGKRTNQRAASLRPFHSTYDIGLLLRTAPVFFQIVFHKNKKQILKTALEFYSPHHLYIASLWFEVDGRRECMTVYMLILLLWLYYKQSNLKFSPSAKRYVLSLTNLRNIRSLCIAFQIFYFCCSLITWGCTFNCVTG